MKKGDQLIMTSLLARGATYDEICSNFKWEIPEFYNIADDVCDRWAQDESRIALVYEDENKKIHNYTFSDIRRYAN